MASSFNQDSAKQRTARQSGREYRTWPNGWPQVITPRVSMQSRFPFPDAPWPNSWIFWRTACPRRPLRRPLAGNIIVTFWLAETARVLWWRSRQELGVCVRQRIALYTSYLLLLLTLYLFIFSKGRRGPTKVKNTKTAEYSFQHPCCCYRQLQCVWRRCRDVCTEDSLLASCYSNSKNVY